MKGIRIAAVAALSLAYAARGAAADSRVAHWVPADQVVVEGQLAVSAFDSDALREMEHWLLPEKPKRTVPSGSLSPADANCDQITVSMYERELVHPAKLLSEVLYSALGRVASTEVGVYRGRVTTLVTVTVDRWLRFPGFDPPPTVRYFAEEGEIEIGQIRYCRRGFRSEAVVPGGRILLATSNVLQDQPLALLPYDNQVFYETSKGSVSLGAAGKPEWAESWLELEARLGLLSEALRP